VFSSQSSGAFFDIAGLAEVFHAPCLGVVTFPAQMLPLSRLSASFVERIILIEDRQSHSFRAGAQ